MEKSFRVFLTTVALLVAATIANAQQVPDPRIADLVRTGKLRVALFLPQYIKDPVTGEIRGNDTGKVTVQVAHALATRLGIEVVLVGYPTPPEVVGCLKASACDVAFIGINPARAAEVGLSPPVIEFDYTYLVPAGSSIRNIADADRPGVRIAVVRNHASTLALSRVLKHAETVGADIPGAAFDLLRTGHAHAFASPRQGLLAYSAQLPGSRVLEDRYGVNRLAMAVPKGQSGWLAYVSEFIEEAKASGLVQQAIDRAGERGIQATPPGNPAARN